MNNLLDYIDDESENENLTQADDTIAEWAQQTPVVQQPIGTAQILKREKRTRQNPQIYKKIAPKRTYGGKRRTKKSKTKKRPKRRTKKSKTKKRPKRRKQRN